MINCNSAVKLIGAKFTPIWSNSKLSIMYESFKNCGKVGESWETSVESGSEAMVLSNGKLILFSDFLRIRSLPVPPLVKLIDAATPLSLQVHPDKLTADKFGSLSKSEIWYILQAEPGAYILYGTKDGVTLKEAKTAIMSGNIEHLLNRIPVKQGDVFMIPPGMLHSLGGGITVLEIQDLAGTTYRVKDLSGNRETHKLESAESVKIIPLNKAKALATANKCRLDGQHSSGDLIASTDGYAVIHYFSDHKKMKISLPFNGVYMFCEKGGGHSGNTVFTAGDSLFFSDKSSELEISEDTSIFFII